MRIHHLTVEEALASLHSRPDGLTARESARRLSEFGPNRVEPVREGSLSGRFLKGFTHFFAVILWFAAALAFYAEWSDPGKGMAALGWAVLAVIVINGLFSFWQEYRAEKALAALQNLLPRQVKAVRDGKSIRIPATELVPGDIIDLEEGDHIPADARLIRGYGVRVNNATITGESLPKARDSHPSDREELIRSKNILLAGTSVISGQANALVFATGMHTEFGKIAHLTQTEKDILSPLQKEIIRLSRMVALLAGALGVVFYGIGYALGLSFWQNFTFAIGIIVANVPEGLLPTVTLSLAMGSQRMAKRNALIRHLPSVETLGSATVICTDKTGTLTLNRMAVKRIYLDQRDYDPSDVQAHGPSPLQAAHRFFFEGAMFCQNLKRVDKQGREELLGDPMEAALFEMARSAIPDTGDYPRVDEIPFDSDRKRLSTLHRTPGGLVVFTKGALESVLPLCRWARRNGSDRMLSTEIGREYLAAEERMATEGLRVLAFAHRVVPELYERDHLEEELVLAGLVGLEDPPRPEVPGAIQKCREAGIRVIMVTGDHPDTALAIAREIGLVRSGEPRIVTGDQLRRLSVTQLQLALDAPEIIFARVGADQKMRIVESLKRKKEIVAVTGDGVNDAPALKMADIGIAMGITGTDVARESADMVLMDDNFASIVAAVEEGRAVFSNIQKFLSYILTSNIPEIVPYLGFVLFKIPLALPVIQILAVDLGTDMLPALALGAEKPEPRIMSNPPRSSGERLWNGALIYRAYLFLGAMEAAAAMAAFFFVLRGGGWTYGQELAWNDPLYLRATTACLSAIIVMQIVNVFLCRSDRESVFSFGLLTNRWILTGIGAETALILLIDYTPWGNRTFGTAPIPAEVWVRVLPFALAMLLLEEARKGWVRRVRKNSRL
jgi:sodium/potassium-transporting ATPase subunit alpha